MFDLRAAFGWLSAGRLIGRGEVRIAEICTDTRAIRPGCLFVALKGDRFDAHDFVAQASDAGAAAVMVERWVPGLRGAVLMVPDTRRAFGEIAAGWRRRFELPVIAVTGSNGKTTVKEMIAAILAVSHGESARLATSGNLNNDVGVPMTVMRLRDHHRAAVLELGMNRPGEIAWLSQVAQPTVALVNNAQREHQEFMGSVRATALENGAVIEALPPDGVAVFPGDDEHTGLWHDLAGSRFCLGFGLDERCAVSASPTARPDDFEMTIQGHVERIRLAIDGAHNVRNALAAAACASAIGVSPAAIAAGLAAFRPVRGRLARLNSAAGARLIDDSYNANPDSVRAAIDVLAAGAAPRVLVLGDMGEVGDQGPQFHREVIDYAAQRGIDHVLGLGAATVQAIRASRHPGFEAFESLEGICERALELAQAPATVLVKGSRFMQMERVVAALVRRVETAGAH